MKWMFILYLKVLNMFCIVCFFRDKQKDVNLEKIDLGLKFFGCKVK